jgi:hypothetical protein
MWKIDPKDRNVHKNKHDQTQTHMQNKFVIVKLLYETWGRRERKREQLSSNNIVNIEEIRICTESCQKMRGGT